MGLIPYAMFVGQSGPVAPCGFKPTSSLSLSSEAMLISGILGWGLDWNGSLTPGSCKSCDDFWAWDFKLVGSWS